MTASALLRRLPWWLALVLGAAVVLLGLSLVAKPFDSLRTLVLIVGVGFVLTGISDIVAARDRPASRFGILAGLGWIVAGIIVLAWPGISIAALAIVAGINLIVGGIIKLATGLRREADERVATVVSGLANVIFGILALSWPDVTVLVLALLVGPAIVVFGIGQITTALARRNEPDVASETSGRRRRPRWLHTTGAVVSLVAALGLLGVSAWFHRSEPVVDAFYDPPDELPATAGVLLRSEPFSRSIPDGARAWRILYTTTLDDSTPAIASALVVVAEDVPDGPRPVIAWAHGTTGVAERCAPSLLGDPFQAGAMPALDEVIENGWVLVATDYIGLGTAGPHPYLIGEPAARSVLDAVRAVREMDDLSIGDQTVVWGHSQGGHTALWTGIVAPGYAPDVNVVGIAALAPASDVAAMIDELADSPIIALIGAFAITGYANIYPDVHFNDYVRPEARLFALRAATRCLSEPSALVSFAGALPFERSIFVDDPIHGALETRLAENVPNAHINTPLLIAQGAVDTLVLPTVQTAYVNSRCNAGQSLEYRTYAAEDHLSLVASDSPLIPDLLAWTQDRLDDVPQESGCRTID